MQEQVVVSASAPISGRQSAAVLVHDISTRTPLASFKQSTAAKHCTALVGSTAGQGGLILAVQPDRALLNVYSFQKVLLHIHRCLVLHCIKDQVSLKVVLPERLSCLAVDRRGQFCAGGTPQGRIYLWEVSSSARPNILR